MPICVAELAFGDVGIVVEVRENRRLAFGYCVQVMSDRETCVRSKTEPSINVAVKFWIQ